MKALHGTFTSTLRLADDTARVTVEQRAAALRELADDVDCEDRATRKPYSDVLPLLLPALAPHCVDARLAFDNLVAARALTRSADCADERMLTVAESDEQWALASLLVNL